MYTSTLHRFLPEIFSYAVWLYHRFNPSHRDVGDLLAERGIEVNPYVFYRGFNNLRYSLVSREGLGVAIFMGFAGLHWLLVLPQSELPLVKNLAALTGILAAIGAAGALLYMHKCYRIPARPFWNHWQTATSFGGNTLSLGALIAGGVALLAAVQSGGDTAAVLQTFGWFVALGLVIEVVGFIAHAKFNVDAEHEGAASH